MHYNFLYYLFIKLVKYGLKFNGQYCKPTRNQSVSLKP